MTRRAKTAKQAESTRAANAERGEMMLVLDGGEFVLRPSHEAIEAFENATGKGLMLLAREAVDQRLRLGETAQIAVECIRAWGRATSSASAKGVNAGRVAELILETEGGYLNALRTIGAMLALASTGGYTAQGELKAGTTMTVKSAAPAAN